MTWLYGWLFPLIIKKKEKVPYIGVIWVLLLYFIHLKTAKIEKIKARTTGTIYISALSGF